MAGIDGEPRLHSGDLRDALRWLGETDHLDAGLSGKGAREHPPAQPRADNSYGEHVHPYVSWLEKEGDGPIRTA